MFGSPNNKEAGSPSLGVRWWPVKDKHTGEWAALLFCYAWLWNLSVVELSIMTFDSHLPRAAAAGDTSAAFGAASSGNLAHARLAVTTADSG